MLGVSSQMLAAIAILLSQFMWHREPGRLGAHAKFALIASRFMSEYRQKNSEFKAIDMRAFIK